MAAPCYASVAPRYDDQWGFTFEPIAELIVRYLQLKPDDYFVDVGGGTGAIAHLAWKNAGLKVPALCVEPSTEMLLVADKLEGVKPYHGSAEDFFSSNLSRKCTKIAMCQCVHLFPDTLGTFQKAYQNLPANATMVIVTRPNNTSLPVWESIRDKFSPSHDTLKPNLEQAGFRVEKNSDEYTVEMTKGELYRKLRMKLYSFLHEVADEEIEDGLRELDRYWFPGKTDYDVVKVVDRLLVYIATKM